MPNSLCQNRENRFPLHTNTLIADSTLLDSDFLYNEIADKQVSPDENDNHLTPNTKHVNEALLSF